MITPLDIQQKEFPKSVRGYKEEEVDGFLDLLTLDFEKLIEDNQRLKDQARNMSTELARYQKTENMVLETLEAAKALMGDISASAERRAEILLKNAELDAERITREARESVERLNEEILGLKNRLNVFRTRYRTLLEAELEKFDTLSTELFADKDMEDIKRMLEHSAYKPDVSDFAEKTLVNLRGDNEE
ncbi:MAG: septum formation initiator [Firmicutes bacterium HGW-Firmicutes-11]|jgi:cell division initiation protein|nr:MAG: septum formation initiator [Firmicutes bacterium HGW-Firmicutes-11]